MAAHMKYPPAHEQLLGLAVCARREGLTFEQFWDAAVRPGRTPVTVATKHPPRDAVQWPRDTNDRNISIGATLACEAGWRRAYERMEPTEAERALILLAPLLEQLAPVGRELVPVAA